MSDLRGKLFGNLIPFAFASFVFMSLLGLGIGMEMKDGQMSSCPFAVGEASLCQMSITEHIAQWQQSFLGIPTNRGLLAFLLLVIILISFTKPFSSPPKLTQSAERLFAYQKANFAKIFDPLLSAFSDGILNPKIYEPARF